ncbi:MAG: WecB/TagA/CpsF family glycosyltransferase [Reyranella sp.]|uniref:WecB/TagA/CpsF family glycosyltransferase n=1 Tax=Reyranella sp. TaxID=1929291 RepID=UPI001AC2F99C|nr:WecB/TagA/CpsF family glycosyltransferase [Reyranella sp.]MBN9090497.1 WecB/TagA/CpsF family glycosyltransferase [Reyranella sp.]
MARKLKIAHLVRQYHPSVGGLETYVAELVQRQSVRHRVYIITLNRVFGSQARLRSVERSGRAIIIRIPYLGVRELFIPFLGPRLLDRFDLKHAHATDQLLDLLCLTKRFRNLVYFATTHGLFFHTSRFKRIKKLYLRVVTRRSLSASRAVFAVSENDLAIVKSIGIDAILLRNPIVPLGDFIADGADLIYVGRIAMNKRIDRLIEFAARLTEQDPGITLHIVGADPDGLWGALTELVRASKVGDRIRYHGYLARNELQTLVRSCGYIVSASEYEGFGLSIVEGMSVGLLPVLHDNAAFRETHRLSRCGLICDFGQPCEAATAFLRWRRTNTMDDRTRAAAFARAQSWHTVERTVEDCYARALEQQQPPCAHFRADGTASGSIRSEIALAGDSKCRSRDILGVNVAALTRVQAIELLVRRLGSRTKTLVAFANANLINWSRTLRVGADLSRQFVVLNDGIGVDIASLILHGSMFPANLNGTDLTPLLLSAVPKGTRVFLYGARPDVVSRAAAVLPAQHGVEICGFRNGYLSTGEAESLVQIINASAPDILLVALGNPLQETWLMKNADQLDVPLSLCVGAFFDFATGAVPRAPPWLQNIRMEWLYRLLREPTRLWRRYTFEILALMVAALRSKLAARTA